MILQPSLNHFSDGDVCSNNECDQCFIQDFGCVMYGKMGLPNTKECLKWGGTDCSGGLGMESLYFANMRHFI